MESIDLTRWLSPTQAARRAGVSKQMIVKLMRAGGLDACWTPLGRIVSLESLNRYIEVREQRQARQEARRMPERTEASVIA